MPRWQRVHLAVAAGIVGFAITYFLVDYGHLPHVVYSPLERTFRWMERSRGAPMGYYGMWIDAGIAGLACAGVAWLASGLAKTVPPRVLALALAWAGTAFAISIGWFTWQNWP